jgi:hypothetical protein
MNFSRALRFAALVGAVCLVIDGCATTHESYAPDGRKAYALNCSGLARGWDKCFSAAGNICGAHGYDVIDRSSESAEMGSAGGNGSSFGAHYAKTAEREMVVACKN